MNPLIRRVRLFARKTIGIIPRWLTAGSRVLPDFLIAGTQKGGTSSLGAYLWQHPQVLRPAGKEIHYFDLFYWCGERWYRAQFPTRKQMESALNRLHKRVVTGESTPYYLFHPQGAKRIAALIPQVKIIILLRDPVARAYSHYQMTKRRGEEPLSFEEAIAKEPERLRAERDNMEKNLSNYGNYFRYSYLERGKYHEQLAVYFQLFPREQILILSSEEFFSDPQKVYDQVLSFLGLDPFSIPDLTPRNPGKYDRQNPIPCENQLRDFFRPYNEKLYAMLGRDFGWDR